MFHPLKVSTEIFKLKKKRGISKTEMEPNILKITRPELLNIATQDQDPQKKVPSSLISQNQTNTTSMILQNVDTKLTQKRPLYKSVSGGKKLLKCGICGAKFKTKQASDLHIASVHEGMKPFECKLCDAKFSQIGNLKKHISSVHDGIKPFQCNMCDGKFSQKSKFELKSRICECSTL